MNRRTIVADPWKTLPKDVMEQIARRLNSTDYTRCAAVCKPWRSLLLQSDILRPRHPWLLIPHEPSILTSLRFFNVSEGKFHTMVLPKPVEDGRVVGSSRGWLIMVKDAKPTSKIHLFDPISGAHHELPSPPKGPSLRRLELSSSDVSDCTVAAIFDDFEELGWCKPGDNKWEVVSLSSGIGTSFTLIDVMFCRRKLYVLINSNAAKGKIEDLIVKVPNSDEADSITLIHDTDDGDGYTLEDERFRIFTRRSHTSCLVESIEGQILLVQKLLKNSRYVLRDDDGGGEEEEEEEEDSSEEEEYSDEEEEEEEEEEEDGGDEEVEDDDDDEWKHEFVSLDGLSMNKVEDSATGKRLSVESKLGEEQALFLSSSSRVCVPAGSGNVRGNRVNFIMDWDYAAYDDCGYETYLIDVSGAYCFNSLTVAPFFLNVGFLPLRPQWQCTWLAPNFQRQG